MDQAGRALDDLFAVANSLHGRDAHAHLERGIDLAPGERHDHLATPAMARAFLRTHGVRVPADDPAPSELLALRSVRGGVYELTRARRPDGPPLAGVRARHRYRLDAAGRFRPEGRGWHALIGELLATLADARILGDRLKRCGNSDCGWFFVDLSKNRSREWCEMRTCGNRAHLRRYRERLRGRRSTAKRART